MLQPRSHRRPFACLAGACLAGALLAGAGPAVAADFPEVDPMHAALTEIPGLPGTPAVVLYETAYLKFRDYVTEANSRMDVSVRIKILTDEGKRYGEVEIPHGRYLRLGDFAGRTLTADGRSIAVPEDSLFRERSSKSEKLFVTKVAFPQVEVGAILDYRYSLYWDSYFFLEPWFFQEELPVLRSEITYLKPERLGIQLWGLSTISQQIQSRNERAPDGQELTVWMENLPPIPDEPYGFPFADLSSRFMVVPTQVHTSGTTFYLMDRWDSVTDLFVDSLYKDFQRDDAKAKRTAKDLVAALPKDDRTRAEALYRYVRDEVLFLGGGTVWVSSDRTVDEVLENGQGLAAEQALLLHTMLDAVKIDSVLVWTADREQGRVDMTVANPSWFEGVLVRVDLGGSQVLLDPSDPGLAFGQVPPYYEDMPALEVKTRKPEVFQIQGSEYQDNVRDGSLRLALDEDGRWSGEGTLRHGGHWAWRTIDGSNEDDVADTWRKTLEKKFPSFEISNVRVDRKPDERAMTVRWTQVQHEDEVLGDESSFLPAAWMSQGQPFELAPAQRLTPVQMAFGASDQMTVELTWPEGWTVETVPDQVELDNGAGTYRTEVEVDTEARRLTYTRRFDRKRAEYHGTEAYAELRKVYEVAHGNDARHVVLLLE